MANSIFSTPADLLVAGVFASGCAARVPLGSFSSTTGVRNGSRGPDIPATDSPASKLIHKLRRARLVRMREQVIRFVLVTAVEGPAFIVNIGSALGPTSH